MYIFTPLILLDVTNPDCTLILISYSHHIQILLLQFLILVLFQAPKYKPGPAIGYFTDHTLAWYRLRVSDSELIGTLIVTKLVKCAEGDITSGWPSDLSSDLPSAVCRVWVIVWWERWAEVSHTLRAHTPFTVLLQLRWVREGVSKLGYMWRWI